jgi:hypothetical protein
MDSSGAPATHTFTDQASFELVDTGATWETATALTWEAGVIKSSPARGPTLSAGRYDAFCAPVVCEAPTVQYATVTGELVCANGACTRSSPASTGLTVTCDAGFLPCTNCDNTPATLKCKTNGDLDRSDQTNNNWANNAVCQPVECGVLTFGEQYTLACDEGYDTVQLDANGHLLSRNSGSRTDGFECKASSKDAGWGAESGGTPACKPVQCSDWKPANGMADGSVGNAATREYEPTGQTDREITCNAGYLLTGSTDANQASSVDIRCGKTGEWNFESGTDAQPSCFLITWCDLPANFGVVDIVDSDNENHGTRLLDISDCQIAYSKLELNEGQGCTVKCGVEGGEFDDMEQKWACKSGHKFEGSYPTCQKAPPPASNGAARSAALCLPLLLAAAMLLR